MCGRYASFREAQDLADAFDVATVSEEAAAVRASWNVAPTDGVRVVLDRLQVTSPDDAVDDGPKDGDAAPPGPDPARTREMHVARWGLVPHWADSPAVGARMINARAESVATRPAFAASLRRRRCLVPADGYYEWQRSEEGGNRTRTPFFIHAPDAAPLALAGLYAWWRGPDGWLLSCTILTRAAEGELAALHDRVPAVLAPEAVDHWLDPASKDPHAALDVVGAVPLLAWHEVSTRVNSVRHDGPDLVEPVHS